VATQLRVTASIINSLPIKGRAILTEDEANVIRKEPKVATNKATLLFSV
jgi:hypothetical protein